MKGAGMAINKMLNVVIVCFFLCCQAFVCAQPANNQLNKAFYYVGRAEIPGRSDTSIDLGRFVLLFNEKPEITFLPDPQKSSSQAQLTLFFPYAVVGGKECKKMVEDFNAASSKHYSFHLEQQQKPLVGLRFTVTYDPNKVGFDHRRLETIKYDRGIEIRMYDRYVLDAIKKAEAPRVADSRQQNLKKKRSLLTSDTVAMTPEQLLTV